ncbi:MAG: type II toxin-antitoxin system prevent-host-death family antitoxin [Pseudolysinimonas sp.]
MKTTTESLIGATDFGRSPAKLLQRAENGERIVILRNNKPTAIIIDVRTAERIARIEEIEEDMRLLVASMVRIATDNGTRYELDATLAELGIDIGANESE